MKFECYADELKNTIERAYIVTKAKFPAEFTKVVKISADAEKNEISIAANNLATAVVIKLPCYSIIEGGTAFIHRDNIKRLYNLKGSSVFSADNTHFIGKCGKKLVKIPAENIEDWPDSPNKEENKQIFSTSKDELIFTLENMVPFASEEQARPIYTGINFNAAECRISAVDGYHLLTRELSDNNEWKFCDGNITVPTYSVKELKKIADKNIGRIDVYVNGRYAVFSGKDFDYMSRILEGRFMDVKTIFNIDNPHEISIEAKPLAAALKEYTSAVDSATPDPMMFVSKGNNLFTYLRTNGYETCDIISDGIGEMEDGYVKPFNPYFVKHAVDLCMKVSDAVTMIDNCKATSPTVFSAGDYKSLILPVRPDYAKVEHAIETITNVFAA